MSTASLNGNWLDSFLEDLAAKLDLRTAHASFHAPSERNEPNYDVPTVIRMREQPAVGLQHFRLARVEQGVKDIALLQEKILKGTFYPLGQTADIVRDCGRSVSALAHYLECGDNQVIVDAVVSASKKISVSLAYISHEGAYHTPLFVRQIDALLAQARYLSNPEQAMKVAQDNSAYYANLATKPLSNEALQALQKELNEIDKLGSDVNSQASTAAALRFNGVAINDLYLVRAMSKRELGAIVFDSNGGLILSAQSNESKADVGYQSAGFMDEIGFGGKALASRNTSHFTLNSLVQDHAYGTFSKDALLVVPLTSIISEGMPISSFNPVDVVLPFKDGQLKLTGATIFVDGEIDTTKLQGDVRPYINKDPELSLQRFLADKGISLQSAGLHNWASTSPEDHEAGNVKFLRHLESQLACNIPQIAHAASAEGSIETALAEFVGCMNAVYEGQLTYVDSHDRDKSVMDRAAESLGRISYFKSNASNSSTTAYSDRVIQVATVALGKAEAFAEKLGEYRNGTQSQTPLEGFVPDSKKRLISQKFPHSEQQMMQ